MKGTVSWYLISGLNAESMGQSCSLWLIFVPIGDINKNIQMITMEPTYLPIRKDKKNDFEKKTIDSGKFQIILPFRGASGFRVGMESGSEA